MARGVNEFRDMCLALLPVGPAWPKTADSEWALLFEAVMPEFTRIDAANEQLLKEMSPVSAELLFEEWEAQYGLPSKCMEGQEQTLQQRRNTLINKYRFVGDQSKQFFIDLAASIGFAITITEFSASNPGLQSSYEGIPLAGDDWNFVWQVNAPLTTVQPRTYPSGYGEAYAEWENELLECTLNAYAHDHRILFFSYS